MQLFNAVIFALATTVFKSNNAFILTNQTACSAPTVCVQIPIGCSYNPSDSTLNKCTVLMRAVPMINQNGTYNPWVQIELQSVVPSPGTPSYVALGLSKDIYMGDDSVISCAFHLNSTVHVEIGYNYAGVGHPYGGYNGTHLSPPGYTPVSTTDSNYAMTSNMVQSVSGMYQAGWQYCKFMYKKMAPVQQPTSTSHPQQSVFPLNSVYNPLLAAGNVSGSNLLQMHTPVGNHGWQPKYYNLATGQTFTTLAGTTPTGVPTLPQPLTASNPATVPAVPAMNHINSSACIPPNSCIMIPVNCHYSTNVTQNTCTAIARISVTNSYWMQVELQALDNMPNTTYVALGMSKDKWMGDDSVVYCLFNSHTQPPVMKAGISYNVAGVGSPGHYSASPHNSPIRGLQNMPSYLNATNVAISNGWKYCQLQRLIQVPAYLENATLITQYLFPLDAIYNPLLAVGNATLGNASLLCSKDTLQGHGLGGHGAQPNFYNFMSGLQLMLSGPPTSAPATTPSTAVTYSPSNWATLITVTLATLLALKF